MVYLYMDITDRPNLNTNPENLSYILHVYTFIFHFKHTSVQ